MKLAFLSHQDPQYGTETYQQVRRLLPAQQPRMAYLASDFARLGQYFYAQREIYTGFGIELDDLAETTDHFRDLTQLSHYHGLHLSGGQTPRFLALLREQKLLPEVRAFAEAGGVLVGVSAGAILLTPTIDTAQSVGDDFTGAMADRNALGLVDFHFWPHFQSGDEAAAQAMATETGRQVYAAPDGAGLIVDGAQVKMVGQVERFNA